jgi:hypothetical protein
LATDPDATKTAIRQREIFPPFGKAAASKHLGSTADTLELEPFAHSQDCDGPETEHDDAQTQRQRSQEVRPFVDNYRGANHQKSCKEKKP